MRPGASWTARDLFTHFASPPRRTHLPPTGSIRCLWVRKSTSLKKSVHLGRNRLPTSETPATGSTADAYLLRKRSSDVLDRNSLLLSKCVHSDQRTRRCDRMSCYSVQLLLGVMIVCSWYQKNVRSHHRPRRRSGLAQVERPREGYGYSVASGTAIATRCYCPVHPFIVVIEVSTLQHTRSCVRNNQGCVRIGT